MLPPILQNEAPRNMLALGGIAMLNALFNRIVMTKFFFDYPIVIMMMQMATMLFIIEVGRLVNIIKLPPYTFQRGKDMFLPSLMYTLSTYLIMNCLDGITMPIFPFIQRFAPLAVVAANSYFHRKPRPPRQALIVVALISFGCALSSVYEWSVDLWSLIYGFGALAMHASALVLTEKLHEHYPSTLELVYMNSFNCLCLCLIADLIQDEIRDSFMYLITSTTALFALCLFVLIASGVVFHAAILFCATSAGALNTAVVNDIAGALQIFVAYSLSVYLFYDLAPTWTNIFGVLIALGAAGFYYATNKPSDLKCSLSQNKFLMEKS